MRGLYGDIIQCGYEVNGKFVKLGEFKVNNPNGICEKMMKMRANMLVGDKLGKHALKLKRVRSRA